ncbi:MAG: PAS domain-containing protein [Opitutaceae bacterium]|nr:PAS domain-containing protein [Opitutaceae bacterium]
MPTVEFAPSIPSEAPASPPALPAHRSVAPAWAADVCGAPRGPLNCAQFIIDAQDRIQARSISGDDSLFAKAEEGGSLRQALADVSPAWARALPGSLFESELPLFLPELTAGKPGIGLGLHRLRFGDAMTVTLTPELAAPAELKHLGLADLSPDPSSFARIFLRLRTVEARLDQTLTLLPGVVFHQRSDFSFASIGPGFESLVGIHPQPLAKNGQPFLRLIHEADERAFHAELERNRTAQRPFSQVYRILNPQSGTYLYLLDIRTPVRTADGLLLGHEGIWLDITRQKIAEHRLNSRAWKESLSTLTTGLLQDYSNVMTGIFSLSELYHNTLPNRHPLRDGLGLIKENAGQAQRLLRKILELNRESSGEKTYVNLGRIVREQLDLLKVILPRGAQLAGPLEDGEWPVYIDETAFRQTLVNLAMNARDALRGPGDIRIALHALAAGQTPAPGSSPAVPPLQTHSVMLTFSDNGMGILPAHLERIFDPFFTTKDAARGTGLGLYHARLFAESCGGTIAARSTAGRGTEIALVLPLVDLDHSAPTIPGEAAIPRTIRGLYFERDMTDEGPMVDALRSRDWSIRTIATLEHARRHLREEGARLDFVFVSQDEPDTSLRVFLAELRRDHPGLRLALHLSSQAGAQTGALRAQVDLFLPAGTREPDAVDALAKLLRIP